MAMLGIVSALGGDVRLVLWEEEERERERVREEIEYEEHLPCVTPAYMHHSACVNEHEVNFLRMR